MAQVGTVSSAIALVTHALILYQRVSAVKAYEGIASSYSAQIDHEYFRFESWAEQSGYVVVLDGNESPDLAHGNDHLHTVLADRVNFLVAQVAAVLDELQPLLDKYKIPAPLEGGDRLPQGGFPSVTPRSSSLLPERVRTKVGVSEALTKSAITKLRLGQDTGRLRKLNFGWSLTNEVNDRDKIKDHIGQLTYWNAALRETLPPKAQVFHKVLSNVRTVNNASTPAALEAISPSLDHASGSLDKDIQYAALMKQEHIAVHDSKTADIGEIIAPMPNSWLPSHASLMQSDGHPIATLSRVSPNGDTSDLRVLVDRTNIKKNLDAADAKVLEHRVKQLQQLLKNIHRPSASLLPICAGYVREGPTNHLILYELPKSADPVEQPRSLYELLPVNKNSVPRSGRMQFLPLLDQRLALAQALTTGLLQLHSVCWLHKALNSDNVILFMTPEGLSLSRPLLSGFGLGRAADPGQATIDLRPQHSPFDLYQHPDLRTDAHKRYERRYDIYSLGLILFEIGFWQSLHYFVSDKKTPEDFRRRIVNFSISHLGHLMGKAYQQMVLLCINEDAMWRTAEGDGSDPTNLMEIFSWKVARKMGEISVS